jgi:hypothetical protein
MLQFVLFLLQKLKKDSRAINVSLHQEWCEMIFDLFLFQVFVRVSTSLWSFCEIYRTYANVLWISSSSGQDLVNDNLSLKLLQFTVLEVENALLWLDSSKSLVPNGVLSLFLKNRASAFALPLCMFFYKSFRFITLVCYSHFQEW